MPLTVRKPTGLPAWPIILLTGGEKAGKSWACAEAANSDLIGRTLWFTAGEDDPDEYGQLADFDIVTYDGTYRGLIGQLEAAAQEEAAARKKDPQGKPWLWVIDSGTRLWNLLSDMAQAQANKRRHEDEAQINMDLWNVAKARWQRVLDYLRAHPGPSLITARLETITVVEDGQPVKGRGGKVMTTEKVQAEKNLGADVGIIVKLPEVGLAVVQGGRSVKLAGEWPITMEGFTVDALWRKLGLDGQVGTRAWSKVDGEASQAAEDSLVGRRAALLAKLGEVTDLYKLNKATIAKEWQADYGHKISETENVDALAALVDQIIQAQAEDAKPQEVASND